MDAKLGVASYGKAIKVKDPTFVWEMVAKAMRKVYDIEKEFLCN